MFLSEERTDVADSLSKIGSVGCQLKDNFFFFKVRNPESSWRETRKQLRKDHRWDLTEQLDKEEKEKLFEAHIENLTRRNKDMFHKLLEETAVRQSILLLLLCFGTMFKCLFPLSSDLPSSSREP